MHCFSLGCFPDLQVLVLKNTLVSSLWNSSCTIRLRTGFPLSSRLFANFGKSGFCKASFPRAPLIAVISAISDDGFFCW